MYRCRFDKLTGFSQADTTSTNRQRSPAPLVFAAVWDVDSTCTLDFKSSWRRVNLKETRLKEDASKSPSAFCLLLSSLRIGTLERQCYHTTRFSNEILTSSAQMEKLIPCPLDFGAASPWVYIHRVLSIDSKSWKVVLGIDLVYNPCSYLWNGLQC